MNGLSRVSTIGCTLVLGVAPSLPTPRANADPNEFALNGVFSATSDGQYAKSNDRFHDEATVTATWTISTRCTATDTCSGRVSTDLGWSADVSYIEPMWYVRRTLPDWMHCPDGSTAPGQQTYKFFRDQFDKPKLRGWDNTVGPSGACGVNKVLDVELPFKLIPLG